MKRKRIEPMPIIIVVILCFAVFNDLIRIPNTVISAYRVSLPLVLGIALIYFKDTKKFFLTGVVLMVPLLIQNLLFCRNFNIDHSIDFAWQVRYIVHYASIIAIFILIRMIRKIHLPTYKIIYTKFIPIMGALCVIAYFFCLTPYYHTLGLANRNSYAVSLAAVFPLYLLKGIYDRKRNLFLCVAIFVILWIGDSKAALAGIVIEIGVIYTIAFVKKISEGNKVLLVLVPLMITAGLAICFSPITVNGYSIREMFLGLLTHLLSGRLYENSGSSLSYRTNAMIYSIRGLFESCFLGIGIGNTGKLLKKKIPDFILDGSTDIIAFSPHCAVVEFFCDCGIWAVVLCFYIYGVAIKKLFHAKNLDLPDIYFVSFTISFPLWSMSASGIYTIFLLFIIMAWLYECRFLSETDREYVVRRCV